jgi:hypothetical protein
LSRIFASLLLIVAFLAWNRVRILLTPEGLTQAARELGPALRDDVLASLAYRLQAANVAQADFVATSVIFALLIVALGYFCDMLLERKGFGPLGNMGLLVAGSCVASALWVTALPPAFLSILSLDVFVAALGGAFALVGAALLRHLIWARFDDLAAAPPLDGERRPPRPAARTSADILKRRRR